MCYVVCAHMSSTVQGPEAKATNFCLFAFVIATQQFVKKVTNTQMPSTLL